jgi:hypothetical protein
VTFPRRIRNADREGACERADPRRFALTAIMGG